VFLDANQSQEEISVFNIGDTSMMNESMTTDFSQLGILKKSWKEFFQFYTAYIKDLNYYKGLEINGHKVSAEVENVRKTMQQFQGLIMEVPAVGQNLFQIIKIIREEEKSEIAPVVDGGNYSFFEPGTECFDYFI
jgi:hypothetical protein